MTPSIRPATPEDSPAIARGILLAGRSHLESGVYELMILGSTDHRLAELEKLVRAKARSFCQWSLFLVADVEGEVGAVLSGYNARDAGSHLLVPALREIGWDGEAVGAMARRMAPFLTCASPEPEDAWVVESVATFSGHRRRGLVNTLLQAILEQGSERGYSLMQISVLIGNTPAAKA